MKKILPLLLIYLLFLSGCQLGSQYLQPTTELSDDTHLFIISNKEYLSYEEEYYDALLVLKKQYPEKLENISIISSYKEVENYIDKEDLEHYPCLLVVEEQQVKANIQGAQTEEFIISHLTKTFSNK